MKIIKLLRIKIILLILITQISVLGVTFFIANSWFTADSNRNADSFLAQLAKNKGHRPLPPADFTEKHSASRRIREKFGTDNRNYFAVNISYSGVINELISDFPLSYTQSEISRLILLINGENQDSGIIDNFQYLKTPDSYGTFLICILNRSEDFKLTRQFHIYALLSAFAILAFSFVLAFFLSRFALKQTEETFERQKRFIADAGHELKTPIAVIGANIDVLSSDEKLNENKFFQYIKHENERMGDLVRDLLYLARDDADRLEMIKSEFDFSNAVENAILPFEVVAFEKGMKLEMEIQKGIMCSGDEKSLKQLFVILVDNAVKNSDKGAVITVKAYTKRQNIIYKVRNTGNGIKQEDLKKIFERFYRVDSSRARKTGGYGLGLSIAQTIAQKHGGIIKAESEYGKWAEFTFSMKN